MRREVGRDFELRHRGAPYAFRVLRVGPALRAWRWTASRSRCGCERLSPLEGRLEVGSAVHRVLVRAHARDQLVEVDGVPHRISRDDAGVVRAPAPAVVLSLGVQEGDAVEAGDRLAVLEAMKTELPVLAPCAGVVREVLRRPNVQVEYRRAAAGARGGEPDGERAVSDERLRFDALAAPANESAPPALRLRRHLEEVRRLVLGFDVDPRSVRRLVEERHRLCAELEPDDPELMRGEEELLAIFSDVCALFRRRGEIDAAEAANDSAEQHFMLYLRSLDPGAAALPPVFLDQLRRVLAHYGVDGLDRTPQLEEALLWICKAHQRSGDPVALVLSVLERRLEHEAQLAPRVGEPFRLLLERVAAVARGRHQAVADLAQEVAYRTFDRHFFDRVREDVYRAADTTLERLVGASSAEERDACIESLVECPEPLVGVHCQRFEALAPALRPHVLEVMLRRYYRIRALEDVRAATGSGFAVASAQYSHEHRRIHVIATCAPRERLSAAAQALAPRVAAVPPEHDVVLDFYLALDGAHEPPDAVAQRLRAELEALHFARRLRRVVVVVSAPGASRGIGGLQHFTFRPDPEAPGQLREDPIYRGLHAMMGKRLQIWRLSEFDIERLPSEEDLYLFRGVARANPRDERLFAFAEVRDVTPIRDEFTGRVVRIPKLEMMWMEALAGIRRFQSRRSARQRLHWNRVFLYVWPPVGIGAEEWSELAHRLAPSAADLGLEKVLVRARLIEGDRLRDVVLHVGEPRRPRTGLFDAVVEFDIDGIGTFQSDPTGDVNLLTYVDGVFNGIGLSDSDITNGFIAYYESAVPPFDPSFPWPSELSTYLSSSVSLPFTIALSNGNGDLIIRGIESFDDNASLSSNPEPSTIAIWSLLGLVGLGYGWRKKRKAA